MRRSIGGKRGGPDQYAHQMAYFGHHYDGYETYKLERWRKSYIGRIAAALDLPRAGLYLDIGTGGSGYTVIEAARTGQRAVGTDLTAEGVRRARDFARGMQLAAPVDFVQCSAEALPFKAASFGGVSSIAVFEHLPRDDAAAREVARVLQPGSRAFITVPNAYRRILPLFWLPYLLHDRKVGHLRHYREEDLVALFRDAGLSAVGTQHSGHLVKAAQMGLFLALPRLGLDSDALWWSLERRDLLNRGRVALQLTGIFEKRVGQGVEGRSVDT